MKPYEWMVKHTPQTEWINGRGILFWIAFFFIELGAGMFLVSSIFGNLLGQIIGWLICAVLGGGFHLIYLGHPLRFYRMILRPQTSWISRGLLFVSGFLFLAVLNILLSFYGVPSKVVFVLTNILAFLTIIYGGFAMSYINGIPLWNSALLPILFVVAGLWGGAELSLAVQLGSGGPAISNVRLEDFIRILLVSFIVVFPTYLISARYASPVGKTSVREIVKGKWWHYFWIGVVLLGIVLPIGVVVGTMAVGFEAIPAVLLYFSVACELIGDLILRYLILKNGFYNPLVSETAHS